MSRETSLHATCSTGCSLPAYAIGYIFTNAEAVEHGVGSPLRKTLGGVQILAGDLVVAAMHIE